MPNFRALNSPASKARYRCTRGEQADGVRSTHRCSSQPHPPLIPVHSSEFSYSENSLLEHFHLSQVLRDQTPQRVLFSLFLSSPKTLLFQINFNQILDLSFRVRIRILLVWLPRKLTKSFQNNSLYIFFLFHSLDYRIMY